MVEAKSEAASINTYIAGGLHSAVRDLIAKVSRLA